MSLTLAEARARAACVRGVEYEIHLDLRAAEDGRFGSRTTVSFASESPTTFLELSAASDVVATLDGQRLPAAAYDGRRLHLDGLTSNRHRLVVDARLPYVSDGDGMHTMTDPLDAARYVGAYLGMDIAQKVFCCFDQNDIKAPITISVDADPGATVLSNGRLLNQDEGYWRFATTPPIPPGLVVVLAGPWTSVRWQHAGLEFGWHARASLASAMERDAAELRRITEQCFDHYAGLFDETYPFDSYDQVFVPGLNWGAQEMPGCVTYRDELLPVGSINEPEQLHRAMIIAHEMAHMWFGDLATMTWWEDTWLQESFADYMGFRVAADAAGFSGAQAAFMVREKPYAYDADRRRSTHPIAPRPEEVPDVDSAATIFDPISYGKGNAALFQLATWLGDQTFLAGVNSYLTRFRFANATLADFVDDLAAAAVAAGDRRDVRAWIDAWLRRAGHDTIVVTRGDGVPVLRRRGNRPHRFSVVGYDENWREVGRRMVDLDDDPVVLLEFRGCVVVPNAGGETFARFEVDPDSAEEIRAELHRIEDPLVRAAAWAGCLDLPGTELLVVVRENLGHESDPAIAEAITRRVLGRVIGNQVAAAEAGAALSALAAACGEGIARTTSPDLAAALLPGWIAGTRAVGALRRALETGVVAAAVLRPEDRWAILARLARLGESVEDDVEREGAASPGRGAELGAITVRAAVPDPAAKEQAWALLSAPDVDNRRFEAAMSGLWSAEQAALVAPYVDRYLAQAPAWAGRGQAFSKVVGRARPALRLNEVQIGRLRTALGGEVPVVLRRFWADWLDDLTA